MQVFVTRTGRIIDLATCLVQDSSVLAIVSPSRRQVVKDRLEQYIFFGDKVRPFTPCSTLALDNFYPASQSHLGMHGT